jgi:hypothetical protein
VSQSSEFYRHNPLCSFCTSVYCYKHVFLYRISPGAFGYTLIFDNLKYASEQYLRPIQSGIQWEPGVLFFLGLKRPGRETDHSPPSSAKIKNAWSKNSYIAISLHGVMLSLSTEIT